MRRKERPSLDHGRCGCQDGSGEERGSAFLLRPELSSCWDLVIWLHIPFEDMVARAIERDTVWVGDAEKVGRRHREHWVPLHELYERSSGGADRADLVIDNSKPEHPKVRRESWSVDGWPSSNDK